MEVKMNVEVPFVKLGDVPAGDCVMLQNGDIYIKMYNRSKEGMQDILLVHSESDQNALLWRHYERSSETFVFVVEAELVLGGRDKMLECGPMAIEVDASKFDFDSIRKAMKSPKPNKLEAHHEIQGQDGKHSMGLSLSGDPISSDDSVHRANNDYPGNVHGLGCLCGLCTGPR